MQASKLVADWSMRWSRDMLLKKLRLYTLISAYLVAFCSCQKFLRAENGVLIE